jgi:hypothetical protein
VPSDAEEDLLRPEFVAVGNAAPSPGVLGQVLVTARIGSQAWLTVEDFHRGAGEPLLPADDVDSSVVRSIGGAVVARVVMRRSHRRADGVEAVSGG